jgi:hypothetical protein
MAFGNSKVTKEDLIAAGLDPDEIRNSLKAVKDGSATKEDIVSVTNALTAIQDSFKALETKFAQPVIKKDDTINNEEKPDEQTEFITDPVSFINRKSGAVYGAAAIELKKMTRDLAWKEGLRSLKGLNNSTLRAEIEEEWKKYPPEKMAQFNTDPSLCLQQLHDMVMGRHHDEIMQDQNKKDGKFNLVHSGAGSNTGNRGAVDNTNINNGKEVLTDAEKNMAAKFGMTEDEWIQQGKDMEKEEIERKAGILVGGNK